MSKFIISGSANLISISSIVIAFGLGYFWGHNRVLSSVRDEYVHLFKEGKIEIVTAPLAPTTTTNNRNKKVDTLGYNLFFSANDARNAYIIP